MSDHVIQLADVAGPVGGDQHFDRFGRIHLSRRAAFDADLFLEESGQQGNVFAAFAQRRHVDVDDVEPVIEVFAEGAGHQQFLEIAVGGGDDPHIDRHGLGAADRAHLVFLQHAQQLDLQAHRHVADLIEQQGAAFGRLEQAYVVAGGAGEGAFFMAEQFGLEQVFGHRTAVDGDEWHVFSWAGLVDRARQQVLAGAGFAGDQYPCIGLGDQQRLLQAFFHRRAAGDDVAVPVLRGAAQAGDFHRPGDIAEQLGLVDRLGQEGEGAELGGFDGIGNGAVGGDQDNHQSGPALLQFLKQADPIHVVHAQVGNHQVGPETGADRQRAVAAGHRFDVIAFGLQPYGQQLEQAGVVIDEQDFAFACRHIFLASLVAGGFCAAVRQTITQKDRSFKVADRLELGLGGGQLFLQLVDDRAELAGLALFPGHAAFQSAVFTAQPDDLLDLRQLRVNQLAFALGQLLGAGAQFVEQGFRALWVVRWVCRRGIGEGEAQPVEWRGLGTGRDLCLLEYFGLGCRVAGAQQLHGLDVTGQAGEFLGFGQQPVDRAAAGQAQAQRDGHKPRW